MSAFPPPPYSFDPVPAAVSDPAAGRAAVLVWITGAVQMLLFGCCGLGLLLAGIVPPGALAQQIRPEQMQVIESTYGSVAALQTAMRLAGVAAFVLGFIPGLVYVILGFWVRRARRPALITAMILAFTQSLVIGAVWALTALGALIQRDPVAFTLSVLTFGTLLALTVSTGVALLRVRSPQADTVFVDNRDPWNTP